jgi:hypothetical protein
MKKLLITLAFASTCAHAEFYDGNDLLSHMTDSSSQINRAMAFGYIAGVADTGLGSVHCAPPTVTLKQVIDVVRIALDASPTDRHKAADSLVLRAVKVAWPCANRKRGESM